MTVAASTWVDLLEQRLLGQQRWPTPGALAQALDPSTVQTPALDLIDAELLELADGHRDRLMISVAPQEGKSSRVAHRLPEWLLTRNPDQRIIIVSYSDDIARRWGADIKRDLETFDGTEGTVDLGVRLRPDSRAAGRWSIDGHRGGVVCAGIAGSISGRPAEWLIIDDPLKDLEQAQSSLYRLRWERFWQAVAVPRLAPGARVVLISTRWHEADPAGWLQANEPGRWRVVNLPAIAESDDDPLGREPGQPLISARGHRDWAAIRSSVGEYVWAALYQGRPAPAEGGLFKRAALRSWQKLPVDPSRHGIAGGARVSLDGRPVMLDDCWRFLTVDLAASTKTSADYTAVGVWAIAPDGDLILLDGAKERIDPAGHWPLVRSLRERWAGDTVFVESRMFGTTVVYEAGQAGVPVVELKADTDKVSRALPATARADAGKLWLPSAAEASWVTDWVDELVSFPNAAHDDVADVVAYAARVAAAHWLRQETAAETDARRPRLASTAVYDAYAAATGNGHVDPLTQPWD